MRQVFRYMSVLLFAGNLVMAQPNPIVQMSVTLSDGQTKELSAPESGLAMFTLKDGTEVGVRPTILDSKPWTHVVLTFFRLPTATQASEQIGSVELRTGAPAVATKTTPAFKMAVTGVAESVSKTS